LDAGVRGKFSNEIALPVPDADARAQILERISKRMRMSPSVDLAQVSCFATFTSTIAPHHLVDCCCDALFALFQISRSTPGYVGQDLKALLRAAGMTAVKRIIESGLVSPAPAGDILARQLMGKSVSASVPPTENENFAAEETGSAVVGSDLTPLFTAATDNCGMTDSEVPMIEDDEHESSANPVNTLYTQENNSSQFSTSDVVAATETEPDASQQFCIGEANTASRGSAKDFSNCFVEMSDISTAMKSIIPAAKREGFAVVPEVMWKDIGALREVRSEIRSSLLEPIRYPDLFKRLNLTVPAGIMLFGPPGCGKTLLAKAVANESGSNFISVKGPELLSMYVGESESQVRQVFSRARSSAPCVVFFDELDALCPRRGSGFDGGSSSGVSERVVNQLLTELDGLESRRQVYIIAATNRLELIDDAMLRPGRLGKLLYVPLPTLEDRVGILQALTRNLDVAGDGSEDQVSLAAVAADPRTDGFSGADLSQLVIEAGYAVVNEWRQQMSTEDVMMSDQLPDVNSIPTTIRMRHFEAALRRTRPSVSASERRRYLAAVSHLTLQRCH
jgi:ribosome biogenesis ATPase